jgi:hypothetical protein
MKKNMKKNMKKIILILTVLQISFFAKAQIAKNFTHKDSIRFFNAGENLIKFHKQSSLGNGLMILGSGIMILGSTNDNTSNSLQKKDNTPIVAIGGLIAIGGFVLNITASEHLKKAGKYLQLLSGAPVSLSDFKNKKTTKLKSP